jgi:hypothetical protein
MSDDDMGGGDLSDDGSADDDSTDDRPADCAKCPSQKDAVTGKDLPAVHVCFIPPDGRSPRQCFALETMRRIALESPHPCVRTDNRTGCKTPTFLQPPHFRTHASTDLLDQIADRFGREALELHGKYFGQVEAESLAAHVQVRDGKASTAFSPTRKSFDEMLNRYLQNGMGNHDLYCCPVCYIAAHKQVVDHQGHDQLVGLDDGDDNGGGVKAKYSMDFVHDPMTILGHMDNDNFRIASTFCFSQVASLKDHLHRDHSLDTKKIRDIDAYNRYKVRVRMSRFLLVDPSHFFRA